MDQIVNIIVGRLNESGMDLDKIPSCLETMVNIFFFHPVLNCRELNQSMQSLGWHNFEMDNHTFKLVKLVYNNSETELVLR